MAVQSPKVDTLAKSMAGLDPAFKEQRALVQEQIGGLDAKYDIEKQAMEGTRVQSFEAINRSMVGRGAAFSGIGADEQARYLANEYLPGLQRADQAQRDERMSLRKNVADLNMQQNTMAMSRIDQQQSALNQWNLSQAQMQAQRREAELQRQFQASQSALDRNHQSSMAAANRAATLQTQGPSVSQTTDEFDAWTEGKKGKDGKLSPGGFAAGYKEWARLGGGDVATYVAMNSGYINNSHRADYLRALGISG